MKTLQEKLLLMIGLSALIGGNITFLWMDIIMNGFGWFTVIYLIVILHALFYVIGNYYLLTHKNANDVR